MTMTTKSQAERFAEAAFREKLAAVAQHKPGHGGA
jgi:hypothetical protein